MKPIHINIFFYMYVMNVIVNEKDIITEIISLNEEYKHFLSYIKNNILLINNKINKLDNHFFTDNPEIIDNLHKLYDYKILDDVKGSIDKNTKELYDKLNSCCEKHDFIDDYIDTYFDNIKITYCAKCNLSKK